MNETARLPSIAISAESAMPTARQINVQAAVRAGHISIESAKALHLMAAAYNEALHRLFWAELTEDQELAWEQLHRQAHAVFPLINRELIAMAGGQRVPAGLSSVRSFDEVMNIGMSGSRLLMYLAHHHPLTVFLKNYLIFAADNPRMLRSTVPAPLASDELDQLLRLAASYTEIQPGFNKAVMNLKPVLDAGSDGVTASAIPHTLMLMATITWASGCRSPLMDNAMSMPALAVMRNAKHLGTDIDGNSMLPITIACAEAGHAIMAADPWLLQFLQEHCAGVAENMACELAPAEVA